MTDEPKRKDSVLEEVAEGIIVASTGVSDASLSFVDVVKADRTKSTLEAEKAAAEKAAFLGEAPIASTMWKLTWPDLVGKIVNALYVMVDAIYIGNMAGNTQNERSIALAACTLAMPVDQLFNASIAFMIGVGSSALYSQNLGRNDLKTARRVIGNMYFLCVLVGIILPLISYWFIDDLLILAGATKEAGTLDAARLYLTPLLMLNIVVNLAISHNNAIRGEGNSVFSATCMGVGAIINIILDPILIKATGNSIVGAAYATMTGNAVGALMGVYYFLGNKGAIRMKWSDMIPDWTIIKNICSVGVSGMINGVSGSIVNVIMNNLLITYASKTFNSLQVTEILAVLGASGKMFFFCFMPMLSISHGSMPIYAYCYGAKRFSRFTSVMKIHFFVEVIIGSIIMVFGMFSGNFLASMFSSSKFFHKVFAEGMRYITAGFFANSVTMVVFPSLQATGHGLASAMIMLLKQMIFLIGFAYLFCNILGEWWGNIYAYPMAEIAGMCIATVLFFIYKDVFTGKKA